MAKDERIGLGLIGCGAFGMFCLDSFSTMDEVRIAAVSDVLHEPADEFARKFGVRAYYDPRELIGCDGVDLVHIATPPSSHCEFVLAAARAGKHCLCEKPLAMNTEQADRMLSAAAEKNLIVPVNFILRHNPVTDAVKAILDSGVLGAPLSARLTNCAGDTRLDADHWFWDKELSGGIFVEHGVHFFDLYRYWFGPGQVVSAHTEVRQGTSQEDRVTCEVRHESGTIASHYHGFDQISLMDRTDHRIVCETGDIRVSGWIPLTLRVDAAVDEEGAVRLGECAKGCSVETVEVFSGGQGETSGRGKRRSVTRRIELTCTPREDKQAVYADSVRELLADQIAFLRDRSHPRRVAESNGRDALALAEAAVKLAKA